MSKLIIADPLPKHQLLPGCLVDSVHLCNVTKSLKEAVMTVYARREQES